MEKKMAPQLGVFTSDQSKLGNHRFNGFYSWIRSSKNWRENLFSVFVDNLSVRVPQSALWEVFNVCETVVDVYIDLPKSWHFHRGTTFAFVRYRTSSEMQRAVQNGNNRLIDGWQIQVKNASYGWNDHFRYVKKPNGYNRSKILGEEIGQKDLDIYRDRRSFKDVVLENLRDGVGSKDKVEVSPERFDFAKILILVDNKEEIPSYVNVKFNGELIKIKVSVEDNSSAMVEGERLGGMFVKEEADLDPSIGKANEVNFKGPYVTLSAAEQIGVSEDFEVVNNVGQVNKLQSLFEVERNSQDINLDIVVGQNFGNNIVLMESQVVARLVVKDTNLGSCERTIVPLSIEKPGLNRTVPNSKKRKRIVEVYNKGIVLGTRRRGRRKIKKEMQYIIRENENLNVDCSNFSISNDDIVRRNIIIKKEVEAT
ncbi:hypothetical protein DITRI_Ditri13aG0140400 [Diplodiscus trichospermus]